MPRDFGPYHTDARPDLGGSYRGTLKPELSHPQLDNWADITPDFSKRWVAANEANRLAGNNGLVIPLTEGMPAGKAFDYDTGTIRPMTPAERVERARVDAMFAKRDSLNSVGKRQQPAAAANQGGGNNSSFLLSALQGMQGPPQANNNPFGNAYTFSQYS